jgi:hypothetical protein
VDWTTAYIANLLGEWNVSFERPLETGVIGKIVGAKPGPTIARQKLVSLSADPLQMSAKTRTRRGIQPTS